MGRKLAKPAGYAKADAMMTPDELRAALALRERLLQRDAHVPPFHGDAAVSVEARRAH